MSACRGHVCEDHRDVQQNIATHIVTFPFWYVYTALSMAAQLLVGSCGALVVENDDKATEKLQM